LLSKELWEIASGRAPWIMLLILCPLVGFSLFQAVSLYGEASAAAVDSPVLGSGLSPLDGVLVPTFGGLYLAATLLFLFVAIRTLGREKESGALALLVQLPYRVRPWSPPRWRRSLPPGLPPFSAPLRPSPSG
jgi:ABC-2 type transport system permease protein